MLQTLLSQGASLGEISKELGIPTSLVNQALSPNPGEWVAESNLKHLLNALPSGVVVLDAKTGLLKLANHAALRFLDIAVCYSPMSVQNLFERACGGCRESVASAYRSILGRPGETAILDRINVQGPHGIGRILWIHMQLCPHDACVIMTIRDMTEMWHVRDELDSARHLFAQFSEAIPSSIYLFRLDNGSNIYANPATERILGYSAEEIRAMGAEFLPTVIHPDDHESAIAHQQRLVDLPHGAAAEIHYRVIHRSGEVRWVWGRDTVFERDQNGIATKILGVCEDITEKRIQEEQLERYVLEAHEAQIELEESKYLLEQFNEELNMKNSLLAELTITDALTAIPNRRGFEANLLRWFNRALEGSLTFGLVVVDVDHFKRFNDDFGHKKGDEVLQGVARVLKQRIRGKDFVARYGGEEFVCLFAVRDEPELMLAAEGIRSAIESASWTDRPVTISLGAAMHRPGVSEKSLFELADSALYEAKAAGRNQVKLAPAKTAA